MNHHKRIVLDFDDTLAFPTNRDWEHAIPNLDLINKTNDLFDQGWQIDIFTARGSISCKNREEASKKYLPGIVKWLNDNNVKYHSISFDKPLASYYIDDKGITPEDFIKIDIKNLKGGLSGSDIYTDGKYVHKEDNRAHKVKAWYDISKDFINVPKIDRIVGNTIIMEYIEHNENYFKDNFYVALGLIQDTLNKLQKINHKNDSTFYDYRIRVNKHAMDSKDDYIIKIINQIWFLDDIYVSNFSHGDFGITNMLFTNSSKLYMIDPIPDVFGCTQLDAAKFIASLYVNKYNKFISDAKSTMIIYNSLDAVSFNYLIAAELIRIYKYHPDKKFIKECIKNVFK
jgi:capsule biosynthesis phosphatase